MRLWREGGRWRLKSGHSTYWGPLRGALGYGWRSTRTFDESGGQAPDAR